MARTSQRAPNAPLAAAAQPSQASWSPGARATAPEITGQPTVPAGPNADRVGIVFVHGIGSQKPAETLLDWSTPIVALLSAWRQELGEGIDPVDRGEFTFSGAPQPFVELSIPAVGAHRPQTWVITESWWAALLRAPGLDTMTTYARRGLPGIVNGIRSGYAGREDTWRARREAARAEAVARLAEAGDRDPDGRAVARLVLDELAPRRAWAWIDGLDRIQKELTILSAGPALVLGSVALFVYAPFRHLPIAALRNAAILTSADNFLTTWFGDLPDILDDAVQAANVRARLAQTIDGLREAGCDRVVVVAHSGGAIVSFTTLLDPAYGSIHVDKLVTLGEGLQLAWRLEDASAGLPHGSRLAGNLPAARPDLRWVDFWSTYDPAPCGALTAPDGGQVSLLADSHPVTNRMSILEDHGGYWDNDEGFLIALLRELDTPDGIAAASRFYDDGALRAVRIERRRRRVAVLALWRWIAALGALAPIAFTSVLALTAGRPGPDRLGRDVAAFWTHVPGRDLLTSPLDWIASWTTWPAPLRPVGEWAMGAGLVALVFWLVATFGIARWAAWDARERVEARRLRLRRLDRRRPIVEMAALSLVVAVLAVVAVAVTWR